MRLDPIADKERIFAEKAASEGQGRLRLLLDSTAEAIFRLDMDGNCSFVNRACLRLLGYQSTDELIGKNMHDLIHQTRPDGSPYPIEECKICNAMQKGESIHVDDEVLWRADGTSFSAEYRSHPIRRDNEVVGAVVTFLDISRRKQAQEALRKAHDELEKRVEERTAELLSTNQKLQQEITEHKKTEKNLRKSENEYKLLIKNLPGVVFKGYKDWSGKFIDKKVESLTGYDIDDFHSRRVKWSDLMVKQDLEFARQSFIRALETNGSYVREYRIKSKNGNIRWLNERGQIIYDDNGKMEYVTGVLFDITERKHAEEQLRKSKTMLQSVFDGIPDPLFLLNRNLAVMMLNNTAAGHYNTTFMDAIGKPCYQAFMQRLKPCEGCNILPAVLGAEHLSFERQCLTDQTRLERVVVYPLKAKDSEQWCAIVRISDITEQKKMEQELIQSQKMIALGVLVAGVAHEINNPNNFIMLNAPLLREAWESIVPILEEHHEKHGDFNVCGLPYSEMRDEVFNLFSGIAEGSQRIKEIVQDLKAFSRQEAGDMDQFVDVNTVIKSAVRLIRNLIRKSTKKFRVEYGRNLPSVEGNKQKLEQVMINLFQNACQALSDKEKGIVVASSYDAARGGIIVEVHDEGPGISDEIRPHIMDPFFTTRRRQGGTGLGLSVSATIVKAHGGSISVESQRGIGTTFTVFLPVTRLEKAVKILIVDDDEAMRELLAAALSENRSYVIMEASNGAEACIKLGKDRPDLLILDVVMPDMDGVDVCRLIKQESALSGIKIIVITGFPESSQVKKIAQMGFTNILPKPFNISDFTKIVDTVLKP